MLPRKIYLAYSFPAALIALAEFPLIIYLPTFYAVEIGLGLSTVGLIFAATRVLDIITDPVIGKISDSTSTKWGRRKPYIAIGIPSLVLLLALLYNPSDDLSSIELLSLLVAFYLAYGILSVPHTALASELSDDQYVRTKLYGSRSIFVVIGTLTAAGLLQFAGGEIPLALSYMSWLALLLGIISIVLLIFFLPTEAPKQRPANKKLDIAAAIRLIWQQKQIWKLFLAFFLNQIGNALAAGLVLLYIEYVLRLADYSGYFLGSLFASSALGLPIWFWLEKRVGQARCWSISIFSACLIFSCVLFLSPGDYLGYMMVCVLAGLTFGCDATLPASMLAQCLAKDKLLSGSDRAGHLFALKGILSKASLITPTVLAFPILALVGFNPSFAEPDRQSLLYLTLLYSLIPAIIKLAAFALVWSMRTMEEYK